MDGWMDRRTEERMDRWMDEIHNPAPSRHPKSLQYNVLFTYLLMHTYLYIQLGGTEQLVILILFSNVVKEKARRKRN